MIRAVGNRRVDLSDSEFSYYKELINHIDASEFNGVFESDKNGIIKHVMPHPEKNTSLVVFFFLMNVSFNQRLRSLESLISDVSVIKNKIENLEKKIDNKGD